MSTNTPEAALKYALHQAELCRKHAEFYPDDVRHKSWQELIEYWEKRAVEIATGMLTNGS